MASQQPRLCNAPTINYAAYARQINGDSIVYLLALANPLSGSVFFQETETGWNLMNQPGNPLGVQLWVQATAAFIPSQTTPSTIEITDDSGTHSIDVQPYSGTVVSTQPGNTGGGESPCAGGDLGYVALVNTQNVVMLHAGCYYDVSGISIGFNTPGGNFALNQDVGTVVPDQVTLLYAGTTTGAPSVVPPATFSVTDGFGAHSVPVSAFPAT